MKYVFVDFEMHPIDKKYLEEKKICGREIIEIGAIMLDENFKEVSAFKSYVRPEYNNMIYKKYEELTGITTNMIQGAKNFTEVFNEFILWCGNEEYTIYTWSDCDKVQVLKEMELKKLDLGEKEKYMFEHWINYQKVFGDIVKAEKLISLENALNLCGISYCGRKHDALFDARNTSILFVESKIHDIAENIQTINKYIFTEQVKERKSISLTLGEMFNFKALNIEYA